ncbi:hypothetical protein RZS28_00625 [Methylocapsa polymorpha]|uniref:Uncharacterized protein n=1 Tax=Methylocapsa polymorpha TaxID=3080828 RepID=A0ABZ0HTX1_9HYPH|nr:hypothetical protein RZS28_00625 [Methylocapsa sp. RX1]
MSNVTYISHDSDEPPESVKVNTKGLPPARSLLARFVAWKAALEAELDLLRKGRSDLAEHIDRLECVEAKHREDKTATSLSVLEKIRAGLPYAIVAPSPSENTSELPIAREALAALDVEIGEKDLHLDQVAAKIAQHAKAAVREHAKALGDAYNVTLATLRDQTAQLAALSRLTGHGHGDKLVAEVIGFDIAGHPRDRLPMRIEELAIAAARKQWSSLAARWQADPRAAAELKFEGHDAAPREEVVYDRLSPLERQIVDIEFARKGN